MIQPSRQEDWKDAFWHGPVINFRDARICERFPSQIPISVRMAEKRVRVSCRILEGRSYVHECPIKIKAGDQAKTPTTRQVASVCKHGPVRFWCAPLVYRTTESARRSKDVIELGSVP